MLRALHTLVSSLYSICAQGEEISSVEYAMKQLHTHIFFRILSTSQGELKYAFQTYFIYIESNKIKSLLCHPQITHFTHNRPSYIGCPIKDMTWLSLFSRNVSDFCRDRRDQVEGLIKTLILGWFLLKLLYKLF